MQQFSFQGQELPYHYYSPAAGIPVVLLHGFLEQQAMWGAFRQMALSSQPTVTLNLPGHGGAPVLGHTHRMDLLAEVVNALLEQLQLRKVVLHGHSMGGYVALAFAQKYPEKLAGLLLQNSTPRADTEERKQQRDRAIKLAHERPEAYIKSTVPQLFNSPATPFMQEAIQEAVAQGLHTSRDGVLATLRGLKTRPDRTKVLENLSCPKLILAGKNDPLISLQSLTALKGVNGTQVAALQGGHMSHYEDKEGLAAAVKAFLLHLPKGKRE